MGKLLLIGAVVLTALLLCTLFLAPSDTTATPSDLSGTTDTIQNISTDMLTHFGSFLTGTGTEDTTQNLESEHIVETTEKQGKQPEISRHYTFSSGTDKQYIITQTPETVPFRLRATFHPPVETYTKGYTDLTTKKWKEVSRTIYSPQSQAEIIITDHTGRVVSTLGFGGKYSTELITQTTLYSQEQYTFTITGNHISLDLSCSYP